VVDGGGGGHQCFAFQIANLPMHSSFLLLLLLLVEMRIAYQHYY